MLSEAALLPSSVSRTQYEAYQEEFQAPIQFLRNKLPFWGLNTNNFKTKNGAGYHAYHLSWQR